MKYLLIFLLFLTGCDRIAYEAKPAKELYANVNRLPLQAQIDACKKDHPYEFLPCMEAAQYQFNPAYKTAHEAKFGTSNAGFAIWNADSERAVTSVGPPFWIEKN